MTTDTVEVQGMHCASCAINVENAVKKLPGVSNASVNFATEKLYIEYDNGRLPYETIETAVKKAGYRLEQKNPAVETVTLSVDGMHCASCSAAVERALGNLEGVSEASVNLATEKATVKYDPLKLRVRDISNAIKEAGYTPREEVQFSDTEAEKREKEVTGLRKKFRLSLIFAAPLLYIAGAYGSVCQAAFPGFHFSDVKTNALCACPGASAHTYPYSRQAVLFFRLQGNTSQDA